MQVAAIVLAAGASERMGAVKALLPLGDASLLARSIALVLAGGCEPVFVVEGAHALTDELARLAATGLAVRRVTNEQWPLGPLASLQAGLRAAWAELPALAGLLVQRVEQPRVAPATVAALLAALRREPDTIVQPQVAGVSGHPLVFPRACFDDLLALAPAHASARTLLAMPEHAARRRKLACDDPSVLDNIDTPADYQRLCEAWRADYRRAP